MKWIKRRNSVLTTNEFLYFFIIFINNIANPKVSIRRRYFCKVAAILVNLYKTSILTTFCRSLHTNRLVCTLAVFWQENEDYFKITALLVNLQNC